MLTVFAVLYRTVLIENQYPFKRNQQLHIRMQSASRPLSATPACTKRTQPKQAQTQSAETATASHSTKMLKVNRFVNLLVYASKE